MQPTTRSGDCDTDNRSALGRDESLADAGIRGAPTGHERDHPIVRVVKVIRSGGWERDGLLVNVQGQVPGILGEPGGVRPDGVHGGRVERESQSEAARDNKVLVGGADRDARGPETEGRVAVVSSRQNAPRRPAVRGRKNRPLHFRHQELRAMPARTPVLSNRQDGPVLPGETCRLRVPGVIEDVERNPRAQAHPIQATIGALEHPARADRDINRGRRVRIQLDIVDVAVEGADAVGLGLAIDDAWLHDPGRAAIGALVQPEIRRDVDRVRGCRMHGNRCRE